MLRRLTHRYILLLLAGMVLFPIDLALFPAEVFAQQANVGSLGTRGLPGSGGLNGMIETANLDISINDPTGAPLQGMAVVTLAKINGQVYRQSIAKKGYVRFSDVAPTEYTVQVVAPAYERAVKQLEARGSSLTQITIVLNPSGDGSDIATALALAALKPKAQKEAVKATEALRDQKPEAARGHLEKLNRLAPHQAEVSYLFGVYFSELKDWEKAKSYWMQTLALNRNHLRTLVSLGEISIQEKKNGEAMEYARRAVEADSVSWRAHAILAEAALQQGQHEESVKEAERALELAHGQASVVQPLLARALAERGDKERASAVLENYIHEHPVDTAAKKQLELLHAAAPVKASSVAVGPKAEALNEIVLATMGSSNWMPPDIDESVPPLEPGATCALEEVVQNAGARMQELIQNVDRFTATEAVTHELIDKKGLSLGVETAKFDYVVSIEALRGGFLNVDEYRQLKSSSPGFPGGIATNGLPAMVLAFHPRFAKNYEMSCEGLARASGQLAWQVHFLQRKDRPNELRSYKFGGDGPRYQVPVKGRAWIAADTYQIVRIETDLVAPLPEIRLMADHIAVEYGPVHFRGGTVDMWLPQIAEVFYQWKGTRVHRQHRFSNYLLFSVEDKQKISTPKQGPVTEGENRR
jgi:tetratricopeptide (TPR) repeat protein